MKKTNLKVSKRDVKQAAGNKLRREGFIPAVMYNHGKTDHIKVETVAVKKLFADGISESTLIDLDIDGQIETAFIKDYQVHPVTDDFMHIDFYRITAGEKIKTSIQLQLIGSSVGEKEGGVREVFLHDIEVETYPRFLVPSIEVDLSELKIGDAIHLQDIQLPEETTAMSDGNPIICHIIPPAKLVEETTETEGEEQEGEENKKEEENSTS